MSIRINQSGKIFEYINAEIPLELWEKAQTLNIRKKDAVLFGFEQLIALKEKETANAGGIV
jgi:hypothetical protein